MVAGLAGAVLAAWLSARFDATHVASQLAWDGRAWSLDGRAGSVDVMLDLGPWMLLRFDAGRGATSRWLPLPLAKAGAAAHRCRAALHDPVAAALNPDAHPQVAPNGGT